MQYFHMKMALSLKLKFLSETLKLFVKPEYFFDFTFVTSVHTLP